MNVGGAQACRPQQHPRKALNHRHVLRSQRPAGQVQSQRWRFLRASTLAGRFPRSWFIHNLRNYQKHNKTNQKQIQEKKKNRGGGGVLEAGRLNISPSGADVHLPSRRLDSLGFPHNVFSPISSALAHQRTFKDTNNNEVRGGGYGVR